METRIYQNEEVEHGHADKSEFERTRDKISELSSWAQRPSQAIPNSIIIRRRTNTVLTKFTINLKQVLRVQKFWKWAKHPKFQKLGKGVMKSDLSGGKSCWKVEVTKGDEKLFKKGM